MQTALDEEWKMRSVEHEESKRKVNSCIQETLTAWGLSSTAKVRAGSFGRKPRELKWDEICADLIVSELSKPEADLITPVGPKPKMPSPWTGWDFPTLLPRVDLILPKPPAESAEPVTKKRKIYLTVSDDLKYQFFDLHRKLRYDTWRATVDWVNENLSEVYDGTLTVNIVNKWRRAGFESRPPPRPLSEVEEKKKPGPKKRELKLGEFKPWHNLRVSIATLTLLASILTAQVVAGIPVSTPIILCCARAVFSSAGISWQPKTSWARTFAGRIGLTLRKGTRAARHLPANFTEISHLHVLRFVWLVATYGLLQCFVFNGDETGVRFMPLKGKTWAEKGAKQVSITALDDK
jgi:hypothetical protein